MAETIDLKPVAVDLDTWVPSPDSTKWQRLDDFDEPGEFGAVNSYITAPSPSDGSKFDTYQVETLPGDTSDRVVRVVMAIRTGATPTVLGLVILPRVRIGTVNVDLPGIALADLSGANVYTYRELFIDFTSFRPGGGAWLRSDFGSGAGKASFGMAATYTNGDTIPRVTALEVRVTKQPVGVLLPAVRRAAAVASWRGRMVPVLGKASLGPRTGGALELGDDVYASDRLAPTPEGQGWGTGLDQARPLQVRAIEDDLSTHLVGIQGLVLRGQVVLFADSGRTIGPARAPNGITRLEQAGVAETFERSSVAWVEQPDGLVGQALIDEPAIGKHGRLHEGRAVNDCPWPAFQDGHTWSQLGSTTFVTDEALFAPEAGARGMNVPAGSAPLMSGIALPVGKTVLSIDYRTLPGAAAQVRIRRASNADYYTVATDSWGASVVDNPLPAHLVLGRHDLRISHTGSATTYSLRFVPTSGTVRVFHVQSEAARKGRGWPSSRIVNRGTATSREHSYLELSNDEGANTWPGQDGTVRQRFRPNFSAHDADGGGPFVLWHAVIGEGKSEEAELRYVPPASSLGHGLLELAITVDGGASTYTVGLQLDVVAGQVYRIASRWQARDQNGDAPGTISVWCDGAVAKAAGPGAAIVFAAGSIVVRGGRASVDGTQAEGYLWDEIVDPFVLSDGELEDW